VNTGQSIYKLDGVTGSAYPAYGSSTSCLTTPVVHTDGTILAVSLTGVPLGRCNYPTVHPFLTSQFGSWGNTVFFSGANAAVAVVAINPITGLQNFSISMEDSTFV
jgi:hypothetical protein